MPSELPLVTVVVPALDAEAWIGEALSSVIAQTYPKEKLEIVVVDDGSSDETAAAAVQALNGSGIAHFVLQNPSPLGPSAARNRGWRSGHGQWVQFLDADDRLDPSKVEVQATAAAKAGAEVAVLFSPWGRLVLNGKQWVTESPWVEPQVGDDPLLAVIRSDSFMQLGSLLFGRSWLERTGGFVESFSYIEDVDLMMRLIIQGGALVNVAAPRPLAWYRQRSGSLSRTNDELFIEGCLRNARLAEAHWTTHDQLSSARAEVLSDVYFRGARYYAERDSTRFQGLLETLNRINPGFTPKGPRALRLLTQLVGYGNAERFTVGYRRLRRTLYRPSGSGRPPAVDRATKS